MTGQTPTQASDTLKLQSEFGPHSYAEWKTAAEALLKGASFDKKMLTPTYEGITLQPLYRRNDVPVSAEAELPGSGSGMRSALPEGYTQKSWEVSQELPYGTPREFNRVAHLDVARGQTELNIQLDFATCSGKDPDYSQPSQVGLCGLSLSQLKDVSEALRGIDLKQVSTYWRTGASALPLAALFLAHTQKTGLELQNLKGCFESDPLGAAVLFGKIDISLHRAFDDMAKLTTYCADMAPSMQTIGIQGHPYHNAGASAVEELACVVATALQYVREMEKRGVSVALSTNSMRFGISIGQNFFMEIAKIRALRSLWGRIVMAMEESETPRPVYIHARTSIWNKTVFDPYVNILRGTTEAFSAVLGGANGIHVGPFDEIIRQPDDFSRRVARNIQLILRDECDLTHVIDPAGGSYYIEWLTAEIATRAYAKVQEIESVGGMAQALTQGLPQKWINETARQKVENVQKRRDIIVGSNAYPNAKEQVLERFGSAGLHSFSERSQQTGSDRVESDSQSNSEVLSALAELLNSTGSPLCVAKAVDAARAGATLGEISKTVWGQDRESFQITPLKQSRAAASNEELRLASLRYQKQKGTSPLIHQINFGPSRTYRLRADWTSSFFEVGGFSVKAEIDYTSLSEVQSAVTGSDAKIIVLVSTDDTYASQGCELAKALRAAAPTAHILLAGAPENEVALREAGIDDFVNVKSNNYNMLSNLLKKIGVL